MKREKSDFEAAGMKEQAANATRNIRLKTAEYKEFSEDVGIRAKTERLRVCEGEITKALKGADDYGIMMALNTNGGDGVEFLCKLDKNIYSCVSRDIASDDVIITEKQIEHIFEGHSEEEHVNVVRRLSESIRCPDYILRDYDPRTAVVLKRYIVENDERYRIIVKLAADDPKHPKNSVITAFYISEKKWNKYLRNKKILYKREEL